MRMHCPAADSQGARDFLIVVTLAQAVEDLVLAVRQARALEETVRL